MVAIHDDNHLRLGTRVLDRLRRETAVGAGSRGYGVTEFALVAPIFLLLVFGIVDLGRGTMVYNTVAMAAQEGARFGMVLNDASWGTGPFAVDGNMAGDYGPGIEAYLDAAYAQTIVGRVARRSGALDLSKTSVNIACPSGTTSGRQLTVTVSQLFVPASGSFVLRLGSISVTASSSVLLE